VYKKPFFSIITVNYNSGEVIKDTIKSLSTQTFKDFEFIVIDGGSTDESFKIIKSSKDKKIIDKLIIEKDQGIFDAMNKGANNSSGEYLLFLNADDFLIDKFVLSKVKKFIDQNKEYDIYYGNLLMVDSININKVVRNWINKENENKKLVIGGQITQPSAFIKRQIFDEIKFNINYKIASDYDFFLRCNLKNYKFKHIPFYIVKMRIGGASNGSLAKSLKANIENFKILKNNNIKTSKIKYFFYRFYSRFKQLFFRRPNK
jgi:glycosyltransferase